MRILVVEDDADFRQALAERLDGRIEITARPGAFVMRGEPLARIAATTSVNTRAGVSGRAASCTSRMPAWPAAAMPARTESDR